MSRSLLTVVVTIFSLSILSTAAHGASYDCNMNGHIKIDGQPMNITVQLEVGLWGYGSVKSGSYRYTVADGQTGEGQLLCAPKVNRNQICVPTLQDPILDRVIITPLIGPVVQVRGQAPVGSMTCQQNQ